MSVWLRLHIAAAYLGLALLLLHCRARADSPLTLFLLWLTWIVMISGVVGFYGQKLLYFVFAGLKESQVEVGFERLEPERKVILAKGHAQSAVLAPISEAVEQLAALEKLGKMPDGALHFAREAVAFIQTAPTLLGRQRQDKGLEKNEFNAARSSVITGPAHIECLDCLEELSKAPLDVTQLTQEQRSKRHVSMKAKLVTLQKRNAAEPSLQFARKVVDFLEKPGQESDLTEDDYQSALSPFGEGWQLEGDTRLKALWKQVNDQQDREKEDSSETSRKAEVTEIAAGGEESSIMIAHFQELRRQQRIPDAVLRFLALVIPFLDTGFRFLGRHAADKALEERHFLQTRLLVDAAWQECVDYSWSLVEKRRQLDTEYRLHRLGRLWLLFHGPAAWALLVLILDHVFLSLRYGGW